MGLFFQSKKSILPLLNGMVDMHNHVLPGIDDGADTLTESLRMMREYERLGMAGVVASPHVMDGVYANTPETIGTAFSELKEALAHENLSVSLQAAAAEYMLDATFQQLLQADQVLPITKKHLLVEMSYLQPPLNVETYLFNSKHKGYTPILAHPERYPFIKDDAAYKKFQALGCVFQLNLLSLTAHYGPQVQKKALALLEKGRYAFVGTDAHHVHHLKKIGQITLRQKHYTQLAHLIANTTKLMES
ncbi:tyrosine-protein phosphatase [Marixanthomonas spongiae]|uniref:protein-tyrosine-phosphatase n=1 Tax=Marixanthomonas spongiae TaxID=2174845 RepID=A0A2U0I3S2_9FLAO|nr:CpsB/CapC family capsule biosynthesis tyrosine phosphatase [Marixanthomonas spongiae]PVW15753.1 histidinol phosphatase [Marixanthomonas spongiae]